MVQDRASFSNPQRLAPEPVNQAPYPSASLSHAVKDVMWALDVLSGGMASEPVRIAAVLSSISTWAQARFDVVTSAPQPLPCSLFMYAMSPSGSGKSTAFAEAFFAHDAQDATLNRDWIAATRSTSKAAKSDTPVVPARKLTPSLLRSDLTWEGFVHVLASRPLMTFGNPDGASFLGNWSFGGGRAAQTLSGLSSAWSGDTFGITRVTGDGIDVTIRGARLSMCLLTQPTLGLPLLISPEAAHGFAGRTLVSLDSKRQPLRQVSLEELDTAKAIMNAFWSVTREQRARIDEGAVFDNPAPVRDVLELDDDALTALSEFQALCFGLGEQKEAAGAYHEASFYFRAHEHAARLAAVMLSYDIATGAVLEPVIDEQRIRAAMNLATWYARELGRVVDMGSMTEITALAQSTLDTLMKPSETMRKNYYAESGIKLRTLLSQAGPRALRGDAELRGKVVSLLEDSGIIQEGQRGRFQMLTDDEGGDDASV